MRKRTKVITITILMITIGVGVYFAYKDTHKKKPYEYETDVEREKYINEFSKLQGESVEHEIVENAGGYVDVDILNKGEILKVEKNIDIMLSTNTKVSGGIAVLHTFYTDVKNKSDSQLSSYYYTNKEQLSAVYGITSEEEFNKLSKSLSFIDGGKIISASIVDDTLKKVGNTIDFDLALKTDKGKTQIYKLRVVVTVIEGKKGEVLVYWS